MKTSELQAAPLRGLARVSKSDQGRLVQLLLLFKALFLLGVITAVLVRPMTQQADIFHSKRQHWTADGYLTFDSYFTTWDAEHYLQLSEVGYEQGSPACAFYPLWPLLIRCFATFAGGNHVVAGMVLSNLLSLAGILLFAWLTARRLGQATAWLATLFLVLFPGALFFQFIYSESLFFLLLMLLWLGLDQDRFWLAFTAGMLLPLARAVGIFCVLPILLHLLMRWPPGWFARWIGRRRCGAKTAKLLGWGDNLSSRVEVGSPRPPSLPRCLLVTAPVAGWSLYFLLVWHWTGNPFEGFKAQEHWGVQSMGNLIDLPKFVVGFFTPTTVHEFVGSLLDRCVFVFVLWWLPSIWRLDKGWLVWTIVLGILPAVSGTFCSYTRFASVVFPVFIAMAVFFAKPERKIPRLLLLGGFAALHMCLLWRFVTYRWAG